LPLTLRLDDESQRRRSEADFELGRLRDAADPLRDPESVLVDPTRESEVVNVANLRDLLVLPSEMVTGRHDVALPYDLPRYTRVMDRVIAAVPNIPVSEALKLAARGLAGTGEETIDDEHLPWRTSDWSFAALLGSDSAPAIEIDALPARARRLFGWMDHDRPIVVDNIATGLCELIYLEPFDNTFDLLHIYVTIELIKAGRLQRQVLPLAEYFVRNRRALRAAYRDAVLGGDHTEWFRFVAACIATQSRKQTGTALEIAELPDVLEGMIGHIERRDGYVRLIRMLAKFQFVNARLVAECCEVTPKRARELLRKALENGFVVQVGDSRRERYYESVGLSGLTQRYAGVVTDAERRALRGDH
jgi:hypothetical protein